MEKDKVFESRKARLLREFPKTFPGETPPTTDDEVQRYLDEEQFLAVRSLVNRQYSWWHPTLPKPTSREAILAIRQVHLGHLNVKQAFGQCEDEAGKNEIAALIADTIKQQRMAEEEKK